MMEMEMEMDDTAPKKRKFMTTDEALLLRDTVINAWRPQSAVWAFKWGDDILGCLTIFGSLFITHKFRRELKLLQFARLTCYVPVVGIAAMTGTMFQSFVISSDIIKAKKCPLCVSTKASIAQVFFGVGYPTVAASIVCFYMADRLLTYPVPPLRRAPREVFQLFQKLVLKNPRPYLILGGIHMIASSFITYKKQQTLIDLELKQSKY